MAHTVTSAATCTMHAPGPPQAPLQLSKRQPDAGVAESATFVPSANGSAFDVNVSLAEPMGAEVIAYFPLGEETGNLLTARLSPRTSAESGRPLRVAIDAERFHFFDPETELSIV